MRALALAIAVLAVFASPAIAHRLSLRVAADKARLEAHYISGEVDQHSRISVRYCHRKTQHSADCRVRYRFVKDGKLTGERCYQTIRVRFASETSRALVASFPPASVRC